MGLFLTFLFSLTAFIIPLHGYLPIFCLSTMLTAFTVVGYFYSAWSFGYVASKEVSYAKHQKYRESWKRKKRGAGVFRGVVFFFAFYVFGLSFLYKYTEMTRSVIGLGPEDFKAYCEILRNVVIALIFSFTGSHVSRALIPMIYPGTQPPPQPTDKDA